MDAVNRPYAPYEEIGTKRDGEWIQLSTNVLQIEPAEVPNLRTLRLGDTRVSPAGMEKLRQTLPKCKIELQ